MTISAQRSADQYLHQRGTDRLLGAVREVPSEVSGNDLQWVLDHLQARIAADLQTAHAWRQLGATGRDKVRQFEAQAGRLADMRDAFRDGKAIELDDFAKLTADKLTALMADCDCGTDRRMLIVASFALPIFASWLREAVDLSGFDLPNNDRRLMSAVFGWFHGHLPVAWAADSRHSVE